MMLTVFAGLLSLKPSPGPMPAEREMQCGRIIISGNLTTSDRLILDQLKFVPGQSFRAKNLKEAQQRLCDSKLFEVNPWQGIGPTVTATPCRFDSSFWDVHIQVAERPETRLKHTLQDWLQRLQMSF